MPKASLGDKTNQTTAIRGEYKKETEMLSAEI
jgi:hypothetical protein